MKEAQEHVASERYLRPAIEICETHRFTTPLSLAVIYDSVVHGSFERFASRVDAGLGEKAWIAEYVRKRHLWLSSVARLKKTTYRTKFFLDQIAIGNWELRLPLNVHGVKLSAENAKAEPPASAGGAKANAKPSAIEKNTEAAPEPPAHGGGSALNAISNGFDKVDNAVTTVTTRTDRAKSLWTTIGGTISQAMWAIFGWLAGIPREVWIVVAIIAALLMLLYLYRQIALGKLREAGQLNGSMDALAEHR